MKIFQTERFKRDFDRLSVSIQQSAEKALRLLLTNHRHPSLRLKKMGGVRDRYGRDVWETRITKGYRATFVIDADTYIFYRVGTHDIERHPY